MVLFEAELKVALAVDNHLCILFPQSLMYTTEGAFTKAFNKGGQAILVSTPHLDVDLQKDANSWQKKHLYTMINSFVL